MPGRIVVRLQLLCQVAAVAAAQLLVLSLVFSGRAQGQSSVWACHAVRLIGPMTMLGSTCNNFGNPLLLRPIDDLYLCSDAGHWCWASTHSGPPGDSAVACFSYLCLRPLSYLFQARLQCCCFVQPSPCHTNCSVYIPCNHAIHCCLDHEGRCLCMYKTRRQNVGHLKCWFLACCT